jgi:hypothetical protein
MIGVAGEKIRHLGLDRLRKQHTTLPHAKRR